MFIRLLIGANLFRPATLTGLEIHMADKELMQATISYIIHKLFCTVKGLAEEAELKNLLFLLRASLLIWRTGLKIQEPYNFIWKICKEIFPSILRICSTLTRIPDSAPSTGPHFVWGLMQMV